MTPRTVVPALWLSFVSLGACATSGGSLDATGYGQGTYGYRVVYADPQQQQRFLGPDWRLDNLRMDEVTKRWVDKTGPDYKGVRRLDEDGDGEISPVEQREEPIFDLRFANTRDGGVIWIKAHPLTSTNAAMNLDVILKGYAEELSGAGVYASTTVFSELEAKVRRYISFVTRRDAVVVGPNLGVMALVELAETERLRVDSRHRSSRLKLLFTKIAYQKAVSYSAQNGKRTSPWSTVKCPDGACEQRCALLVAGYYNEAESFDAHVPEFDRFIAQLRIPATATLPETWRSRPVPPLTAQTSAAK